jgi:hypothetical protein
MAQRGKGPERKCVPALPYCLYSPECVEVESYESIFRSLHTRALGLAGRKLSALWRHVGDHKMFWSRISMRLSG